MEIPFFKNKEGDILFDLKSLIQKFNLTVYFYIEGKGVVLGCD